MTAIKNRTATFFRKTRVYLLGAGLVGFVAYLGGYHCHSGLQAAVMGLPKATVIGLVAGLLGGWIPLAVDLEQHRLWRLYVVLYFAMEGLLLVVLGYSIAASGG